MSGIKRAINKLSVISTKTRNIILGKRVLDQVINQDHEERKEEETMQDVEMEVDFKTEANFDELFEVGKELGRGNFSVVKAGIDKQTGKSVAVKCIDGAQIKEKDIALLKEEVSMLKQLNHPGIIKLFGYYQTNQGHFIVTEYVKGGELFDRIVEKEYYGENDAQAAVRSIASALKYCHDNNIVHRDLKPENLLLASKNDDTLIKLADFGFAKEITKDNGLTTACGTPGYVAPEILFGLKYGKEVDMWSLGVIIYILLCGYPPFYDESQRVMMRKIKKGDYSFQPEWWNSVSGVAQSVIRSLLVVDPRNRMTIDELLDHPWLVNDIQYEDRDITPALEGIRELQARRRLRAGQKAVHAVTRMRRLSSVSSGGKK